MAELRRQVGRQESDVWREVSVGYCVSLGKSKTGMVDRRASLVPIMEQLASCVLQCQTNVVISEVGV